MIQKTLTLKNKLGLHARAANKLIDVTTQFSSNITIKFQDKEADGKSIMSVMLLAAPVGSELAVTIEGTDENAMLEALIALIEDRFDEDE